MLNYEETRESKNTRLTHEISECKDKISEREREREREREQKNSKNSLEIFSGSVAFCLFIGFFWIYLYGSNWGWIAIVLLVLFGIWGLRGIISSNAKLKKINQEIKQLKKQEKELKSQLRF
ncbi:MAG: hypothetical protein I3274_04905 [Candidatus Moeniiplasma glomeromycotorum]|nr:hypothetical protein [Candidatus Moeniiplasma glomeromycotorum]MCE8167988.1 hypothetical protein [Candidatus Moeniiplasma glomeromycotorum]